MLLEYNGRKRRIKFSGTVAGLLRKLKIPRETVLVKINKKLSPENARIEGKDKVEIIRVIFGG